MSRSQRTRKPFNASRRLAKKCGDLVAVPHVNSNRIPIYTPVCGGFKIPAKGAPGLGRSTVTCALASTRPRPISLRAAAAALPSGKPSRLSSKTNSIGVEFWDGLASLAISLDRCLTGSPAAVIHDFFCRPLPDHLAGRYYLLHGSRWVSRRNYICWYRVGNYAIRGNN